MTNSFSIRSHVSVLLSQKGKLFLLNLGVVRSAACLDSRFGVPRISNSWYICQSPESVPTLCDGEET